MEIDVNTTSYLPQFYTDLFSSLLDRSKISYILIFGLVLFLFVGVFVFFGNATGGNTPIMLFIEVILWVVFLYVVVMNIQHMDYNFTTELKNLFRSDTTTLDVNVSKKTPPTTPTTPTTPTPLGARQATAKYSIFLTINTPILSLAKYVINIARDWRRIQK